MRLDAVTYPDSRVSETIQAKFVPHKVLVAEDPKLAQQFGVQWTPTLVVLDTRRQEHRRWEGYLPPADFLAQLELAAARAKYNHAQFAEAAANFETVANEFPGTDAGAEARYWAGVAGYKASGEVAPLRTAWEKLGRDFPKSDWTKKASFLLAPQ